MGSVIDHIECPNCKQEASNDFYYKSGEEYINCQNCGYHYSVTYKTDGDGEYVTKDGTNNTEFENLIMEEKELRHPYGAYRLKHYDWVGYECGSIEDEGFYELLKKNVAKLDTIETFSISRFVDGIIKTEIIVDNGPKIDGAGFSEEDRMAK
jgi:Zn ribbon nucleic-acid-binding protein